MNALSGDVWVMPNSIVTRVAPAWLSGSIVRVTFGRGAARGADVPVITASKRSSSSRASTLP
mgnify:CR=1 FL=1